MDVYAIFQDSESDDGEEDDEEGTDSVDDAMEDDQEDSPAAEADSAIQGNLASSLSELALQMEPLSSEGSDAAKAGFSSLHEMMSIVLKAGAKALWASSNSDSDSPAAAVDVPRTLLNFLMEHLHSQASLLTARQLHNALVLLNRHGCMAELAPLARKAVLRRIMRPDFLVRLDDMGDSDHEQVAHALRNMGFPMCSRMSTSTTSEQQPIGEAGIEIVTGLGKSFEESTFDYVHLKPCISRHSYSHE
jgi:hypothetical protein